MGNPPPIVLLKDLAETWPKGQRFVPTATLLAGLVKRNPDMWGDGSSFGRALTSQRLGRMLSKGFKIHSDRQGDGPRGYHFAHLAPALRRFHIDPSKQTDGADVTARTDGHIAASDDEEPEPVPPWATGTCGVCQGPADPTVMVDGCHPCCAPREVTSTAVQNR